MSPAACVQATVTSRDSLQERRLLLTPYRGVSPGPHMLCRCLTLIRSLCVSGNLGPRPPRCREGFDGASWWPVEESTVSFHTGHSARCHRACRAVAGRWASSLEAQHRIFQSDECGPCSTRTQGLILQVSPSLRWGEFVFQTENIVSTLGDRTKKI